MLAAKSGRTLGQAHNSGVCRKATATPGLLKQTLNVWADVRSVSNFVWNHQCELIFHKIFTKTNRFTSLVTKSLRIFFWTTFLDFCWVLIKFIFRIGCFTLPFWFSFWTNWTKMPSKAKLLVLTRWASSYGNKLPT